MTPAEAHLARLKPAAFRAGRYDFELASIVPYEGDDVGDFLLTWECAKHDLKADIVVKADGLKVATADALATEMRERVLLDVNDRAFMAGLR